MSEFITAVGLVLVAEGLLYGGFPGFAKRMAFEVSQAPDNVLRAAGVGAMAAGVLVVWFVRG